MTNAETISKPTIWDRAVDATKHFLGSSEVPETIRADAANFHRFRKSPGKIIVELNPIREKECAARFTEIEKTKLDKINSAGALRDQKLDDIKRRYEAEIAEVGREHDTTFARATKEADDAEQALLAEFSARPVIEQGATS